MENRKEADITLVNLCKTQDASRFIDREMAGRHIRNKYGFLRPDFNRKRNRPAIRALNNNYRIAGVITRGVNKNPTRPRPVCMRE